MKRLFLLRYVLQGFERRFAVCVAEVDIIEDEVLSYDNIGCDEDLD